MTEQVKRGLTYAISVFLTLFFLYFAFKDTDFSKLWAELAKANYWWALAAFPVLLLSHFFRAWRWRYFLHPVKSGIRLRNLWSAMNVGYMMNNVLPRAGELVRPYAISKLEGVSRSTALGTVIIERIFDVLSFMIVIALIPLVYSGPLAQAFPWLAQTGIWLTAITFAVLAFFTVLMVRRDIVMRLLGFITRHLSPRKATLVEHVTHSFLDGFLFLKEPGSYFMISLLSILIWGLYIIMMYLPFYAFGLTEKYGLDLGAAMVVQAISSIGIVIPTPGSTGPYHYFTIQTLTKLYRVDDEAARSYATVTHAVGFIGITIIGLYYFIRDKLHMADVMKQNATDKEAEPSKASP